ncbi:putative enzyme [Candidatus Desulfarcum epimagneticum]|uniref:Putative enzyme n=1 Tax=uncultured Desulfobacteraceae bacterium TaxID=218296 RepID=A0A484HPE7_9BACT|nr:putative enzyme [uncultured Desulfobacteraceae bacterium]
MTQIIEANTPERVAKVKALFQEYAESLGFSLCFQNFDQELADLSDHYSPPTGALFLARFENRFIGCVGVRPLEDGICEMKRLYVRPGHRGKQAGRKLSEAAVMAGRAMGYARMRLDTLKSMKSAHQLYASMGFKPIAPYRLNPLEGPVYMELDLKKFEPDPKKTAKGPILERESA